MERFFSQLDGVALIGSGLYSKILPWLELLSLIVSLTILGGILYSVVKSAWLIEKIDNVIDALQVGGKLSKRRTLRVWKHILSQVAEDDPKQWKLAILEADKILGDILLMGGYLGKDIHERLERVPPGVLSNVEQLRNAHKLRDRILHQPDFELTREDAEVAVEIYHVAFVELGLLDE